MALAEGSRIGVYRIVRKVGEGGMGTVYEAYHDAIERRVAIKVLHPEFAREQDIATRFINEARAVNRIQHPGLVQISDYGQIIDGPSYIVMEFLDGQRLSDRISQSNGRMPLGETISICRQVASALAAAHEKGIIHRDLKPDNVMLIQDPEHPLGERAKLLDFGLAKLNDRPGTKSNVIMGTPQYMSPEQCRGGKIVTEKSDVYALGILLFEMLGGRLPFVSEGSGELIAEHLYAEPPKLSTIATDLPVPLTTLVDEMLAKQPAARPSMPQVIEALTAIYDEIPMPAGRRSLRLSAVKPAAAASTDGMAGQAYLPTFPQVSDLPAAPSASKQIKRLAPLLAIAVIIVSLGAFKIWWPASRPGTMPPQTVLTPARPQAAQPTTASPSTATGAEKLASAPPPDLAAPTPSLPTPTPAPPAPHPTATTKPAAPTAKPGLKKKPVKPETKPTNHKEKLEYEEYVDCSIYSGVITNYRACWQ